MEEEQSLDEGNRESSSEVATFSNKWLDSSVKRAWATEAGIAEENWAYVDYLVGHESSWNPKATNPSSGAYGLAQALPANKMSSVAGDWGSNPVTQLRWMDSYVHSRYGGWEAAVNFWKQEGWY